MKDLNTSVIQELLKNAHEIAIIAHVRPDGDAIGSVMGLYHFLKGEGLSVTPILPSIYPAFLAFIPESEGILIPERDGLKKSEQALAKADLIFVLDFNHPSRVDTLSNTLKQSKAIKVMLDHHLQPADCWDYGVSDPDASSASELVYNFIETLNEVERIDKTVATCLYAGICSDTGRFKFNVNGRLHRIIGTLLDAGADAEYINGQIFDSMSEARLRFIGFCLSERMTVYPEFKTALMYLSAKDFRKFEHQPGDTEGLVNYPLSLGNVRFVALLKEGKDRIKISFRSKGDFSVNAFSRENFSGGGHFNAAGGSHIGTLEEAKQKILDLLPQYQEGLVTEY